MLHLSQLVLLYFIKEISTEFLLKSSKLLDKENLQNFSLKIFLLYILTAHTWLNENLLNTLDARVGVLFFIFS